MTSRNKNSHKISRISLFRPTVWKVVIALLPFILPMNHIIVELDLEYSFLPVRPYIIKDTVFALLISEIFIAHPFKFLLEPIPGFWWHGPILYSDGPEMPALIIVVMTYAVMIYLGLSVRGVDIKQFE